MSSKRNVYIVIRKEKDTIDAICYSNLTKLVRDTPNVTYSPLYRGLKDSECVERNGYWIVKTKLK